MHTMSQYSGNGWKLQKVSEYDQEIPQTPPQTNPRHREEESQNIYCNKSKATSSLYPFKMIAKLEWTQSNA